MRSTYVRDAWAGPLVPKVLNLRMHDVGAMMYDELTTTLNELLGTTAGEWREVNVNNMVREAITRAASRFTVGLPLCCNPYYLRAARHGPDALIDHASG